MPAWDRFFFAVTALLVVIVTLTRLSQRALEATEAGDAVIGQESLRGTTETDPPARTISTRELYANVALSHGLFAAILVGLFWWYDIPPGSVGVGATVSTNGTLLAAGAIAGIALFILNESSVALLDRLDLEYSEDLRRALAPESIAGWAVLLGIVLPVIAGFEELLFRGVLVGALGVATGVSPWLLAVVSSAVFALGHGIQGQGGVLVTGALGFLLAGLFIATGSLAVVIVAHYLVNALEFVVNEGVRSRRGRLQSLE